MNKILVIEDDINIRENIVELLENEEFIVIAAVNGSMGLELAQETIPDLIICDVMMPKLDGYDVLMQLRQNDITASIPFIFLTAKSTKEELRKGMVLGADDYLTKPFTREELLAAISCRLEKQITINKRYQNNVNELRNTITLSLPHELRTPLNGILGFSKLLMDDLEEFDSTEIREMAASIYNSGERLFSLIQKCLLHAELQVIATDTERIQNLQSQQTVFPTLAFIELINEKAKKLGREADLQMFLQKHDVRISESNLYKIIEELIDNALKFSEPGTPILIITQDIKNTFSLSFTNYGRGMTKEQIAELGAYRQFERQIYEQQGLGLGLIIAKLLTELHGGELKIKSQPKEKTMVEVLLPCV
ncbi:MAG: response regulator [Nostocaceae cyanobacterium]|nr:response regulator [Nostocaceae cyanobacterium]